MINIIYKNNYEFFEEEVRHLYEDAGWIGYTNNMQILMQAIRKSLMTVSAWDGDKLVGLIRIVGDGLTIIYIQDIIVLESHKRMGIGSKLLKYALENYSDVHQKVLLTDDTEETRTFYEANGFSSCDKGQTVAFAKFDY